jgi:hypothetical protein
VKNLVALESHEKKEIKVEWVILDSVKDPIISHLLDKNKTKYMFYTMVGLFQITNMIRKMVLRNKRISMQMSRSYNVTIYFMRITSLCDHFADTREKLDDVELVNVALNGFPKYWEPFVKGVCAQEKIPDW